MENMTEEEKKKMQEVANQAAQAVQETGVSPQQPEPQQNVSQPEPQQPEPPQPEQSVETNNEGQQPVQSNPGELQPENPDVALTDNAMSEETPVQTPENGPEQTPENNGDMNQPSVTEGTDNNEQNAASADATMQTSESTESSDSGPKDYINELGGDQQPNGNDNQLPEATINPTQPSETGETPIEVDQTQPGTGSTGGPSVYEKIANGDGHEVSAIISGNTGEQTTEGPGFSSMDSSQQADQSANSVEAVSQTDVQSPEMPAQDMQTNTTPEGSTGSENLMDLNPSEPTGSVDQSSQGSSLESVIGSVSSSTPESSTPTQDNSMQSADAGNPMGQNMDTSGGLDMAQPTTPDSSSTPMSGQVAPTAEPQSLSPMGTASMENPGNTTAENTSTSELPSLPQAESTTGTAPSIENPVPQSTSGAAAQPGLGTSGTPSIKSLTPQDNVTTQPQSNDNSEDKQKNSDDSGMLTVMLIIGLAVVMGVLIIILVFTFVVTPQEGTFFYSLRETFASIF
jgi:hypothetical protein